MVVQSKLYIETFRILALAFLFPVENLVKKDPKKGECLGGKKLRREKLSI